MNIANSPPSRNLRVVSDKPCIRLMYPKKKWPLSPAPSRRDQPRELSEFGRDGARRPGFHGAVAVQDFQPELGDSRAAPALAARERFHQRMLESGIERLDQHPGAAVGHAHLARRGGDRAGTGNGRAQIGSPRSDRHDSTDQNADFRDERSAYEA